MGVKRPAVVLWMAASARESVQGWSGNRNEMPIQQEKLERRGGDATDTSGRWSGGIVAGAQDVGAMRSAGRCAT